VNLTSYARFEVKRTFRNRRFFLISLAMPILLFCLVAIPNANRKIGGINFATYYMIGMVTFGGSAAVLSAGARIALERQVGWNRQLRITPLSPFAYMAIKVLTGYFTASCTIAGLYVLGGIFGAPIAPLRWVEMTALVLVGLIPFAAIGVTLGLVLTADSMGPALGGGISLISILGGAFGPIVSSGALLDVTRLIPSYWLVRAGYVGLGGQSWNAEGWIVIAAWTAVGIRLARIAYRRDTSKV
jgi:ABC-2 type transport system permease protein